MPHVLGMIAVAKGRVGEGVKLLEQGLEMSRHAGLALRAEEARTQLEQVRRRPATR